MTKNDLKVGMVVEIEDEYGVLELAMICPTKNGLCVSGKFVWFPLEELEEDLTCCNYTITEVFDVCEYNKDAHKVSTKGRESIWERNTPKRLTLHELEKLLGFPIEVIE